MCTTKWVTTTEIIGGSYVYFGIKETLTHKIRCGIRPDTWYEPQTFQNLKSSVLNPLVTLFVGVDGIPLTKSTTKQFWPVLEIVDQSFNSNPFVIALFYGGSKPANLDFWNSFINECRCLENEGVSLDQLCSFHISKILTDVCMFWGVGRHWLSVLPKLRRPHLTHCRLTYNTRFDVPNYPSPLEMLGNLPDLLIKSSKRVKEM